MTDEASFVREELLEKERCGVCGLMHPFLTVCPFVEEREVRHEFGLGADGRRKVRTRIERTRYFPRPQIFEALQAMTSENEATEPPARRSRAKRSTAE